MIKFTGRILKPYRKMLLLVLMAQTAANCLTLYLPTINKGILDYGVPNQDIAYIRARGIMMIALSFLQIACSVLAGICGSKTSLSAARDLRGEVYGKILSLSQREIALFGAPTLITRATNDVQQIMQFVSALFAVIISAPIMLVGGSIMAMMLDFQLSLVIFAMFPVLAAIFAWFVFRIVPYYSEQQKKIDGINAVLRDQISGIRVVKAFVKEAFERNRMAVANKGLTDLNMTIGKITAVMMPLFMFIVNISSIALVWYGGVRGEQGYTQVGTIAAMVNYSSLILSALMMASVVFILMPRADASAKRIAEVLETSGSVREASDCTDPGAIRGEVSFENVGFSYAPENSDVEPVLKGLSFTARTGQTTAIIGSTGCGKTTLLKLIARMMDATEGNVKIDGLDVRDMQHHALEESIGFVPQKAFLFSGTLEENLRHAKPDATEGELWEALGIAQAEEFVRAEPDGLSMRVAEGGSNFSGGQRQRLAIARAIVRRPSIYLFDDSFSALDYSTDRKLQDALRAVTKDAAVIVVAQRISSIINADQIIVMNNGRIEDMGTHGELIRRCGVYQEIVASQPSGEEAV